MHKSVEACLGNELALEHVVPVCDGQLACQDECPAVVPVIDDLLDVVLYLPFEPDHAEVIDDEQVVGREFAEEVGLAPLQMHQPQLVDERVHSEVERLVALTACPLAQGTEQESLAFDGKSYFWNAGEKGRIRKLINKEEQMAIAAECGLNVIPTERVKRGELPKKLEYPIFTKATNSLNPFWKANAFVCNNEADLLEAYKHMFFVV